MRIGVIADTHGYLGDDVVRELNGCDLIVHAGDIGDALILDRLAEIAPVKAIRGNHEPESLEHLPRSLEFEEQGLRFMVLHGFISIPRDRAMELFGHFFENIKKKNIDVLIFGHTHIPYNRIEQDMLLFNPGYAGRSAEHREIGFLKIEDGRIEAEHLPLDSTE